jgi:hypothetical protein
MWQLVGDCGPKGGVDPNHPRQLPQSRAYMTSGHHVTSTHTPATAQLSPPVPPDYSPYHLSPPCIMFSYWMLTSTSSCSRPGHHSESGRRVSYSRDRVCLASEISDTDRELSLSHRSMQIGSRTLQQTLLMQPVVSSGLQQLAGMPLLNTELCSVTPRPIFCRVSSSSACISSVSETVVVFN